MSLYALFDVEFWLIVLSGVWPFIVVPSVILLAVGFFLGRLSKRG
jgi:hypothetical protein